MNAITPNLQVLILKTFNIVGKIKTWMIKKDYLELSQMNANKVYEGVHP